MMDWRRVRKIAFLNHTRRTPLVALAQTLEKAQAGKIKSVYIGIQWEDDTYAADWSNMPRHDLAMHVMHAQKEAREEGLG